LYIFLVVKHDLSDWLRRPAAVNGAYGFSISHIYCDKSVLCQRVFSHTSAAACK